MGSLAGTLRATSRTIMEMAASTGLNRLLRSMQNFVPTEPSTISCVEGEVGCNKCDWCFGPYSGCWGVGDPRRFSGGAYSLGVFSRSRAGARHLLASRRRSAIMPCREWTSWHCRPKAVFSQFMAEFIYPVMVPGVRASFFFMEPFS